VSTAVALPENRSEPLYPHGGIIASVNESIVSSAYVRIWLATFAIFLNFGLVLLAVPLYARDMAQSNR